MKQNEEIEVLFEDLNIMAIPTTEEIKEDVIPSVETPNSIVNLELLKNYIADKDLFERDVQGGFFTVEQERAYRKAIQEHGPEENGNQYGNLETNSSNKTQGKTYTKVIPGREMLSKSLDVAGFVEPLLLSLVVTSIGLLYMGYLYLMI